MALGVITLTGAKASFQKPTPALHPQSISDLEEFVVTLKGFLPFLISLSDDYDVDDLGC